jgi:hypothetical protein
MTFQDWREICDMAEILGFPCDQEANEDTVQYICSAIDAANNYADREY